jgi:hypothetical protein
VWTSTVAKERGLLKIENASDNVQVTQIVEVARGDAYVMENVDYHVLD